jgi:NitT/TauT family transport system permease protein
LIGCAWTYLVVAELIGEKSGISAFIYQQQRYRNFDNVYASIVIIGAVGLVFDQFLALLGGMLFPWERKGGGVLGLFKKGARSAESTPPAVAAVRVLP